MDTIHESTTHMPHDRHMHESRMMDRIENSSYCWQCIASFALAILGLFMMGIVFPFMTASAWVLVLGTICFLLSLILGVTGYATSRDRGRKGRVFGFAGAALSTLLILATLANYAMYQGMHNRPSYDVRVIDRF